MLIGNQVAFCHVPRMGGTFVTSVLESCGEGRRGGTSSDPHQGMRHFSRSVLESRLLLGSIRDPWSWYLSFYGMFRNQKTKGVSGVLQEACGGTSGTFDEVIRRMTSPTGHMLMLEPKIPGFKNARNPRIYDVMKKSEIGLWSWYVLTSFAVEGSEESPGETKWLADLILDAANLERGLSTLMGALDSKNEAPPRNMDEAISKAPTNEGPPDLSWRGVRHSGLPNRGIWKEDTVRMVKAADGRLMEKFELNSPVGARPIVFKPQ